MADERCSLCGCRLHRTNGTYATDSIAGHSHANNHHYVAERYFGRTKNDPGVIKGKVFVKDPWKMEGKTGVFCYDCGEVLLHNPVLLPDDISKLNEIYRLKDVIEDEKCDDMAKYQERIKLFHNAITKGLDSLLKDIKGEAG